VIAPVALVVALALALCWLWASLGLVLRTPNAVMSIGFVLLFPLTFMSSIFVNPATMPVGLRPLARANSITRLASAEPALMQGRATVGAILWVLAAAGALTIVFAP